SGAIASYRWDFSDGGTASGRLATHTFAVQQTYSVTLTVTNDRGVAASTTKQISVGAGVGPTAVFVFSPTQPAPGQSIVFNADGPRAGPAHTIVQYSGISGDGSRAEGSVVQHAFTVAGTYNVTLTVKDEADQKTTFSQAVTAAAATPAPPVANFVFSPTS